MPCFQFNSGAAPLVGAAFSGGGLVEPKSKAVDGYHGRNAAFLTAPPLGRRGQPLMATEKDQGSGKRLTFQEKDKK
jgi:hypothetical protein